MSGNEARAVVAGMPLAHVCHRSTAIAPAWPGVAQAGISGEWLIVAADVAPSASGAGPGTTSGRADRPLYTNGVMAPTGQARVACLAKFWPGRELKGNW